MNEEPTAQRPEAPGARLCPPRISRSGPEHTGRVRIFQRLRFMRTSLRPEGRAPWSAAPSLVPERRQRTLAGGKSARADVAPGWGGKRAVPRRGIGEKFPTSLARTFLSRRGAFFDAPPGHESITSGNRGRRPLPRTCPRLMSCGVPPGRSAGGPLAAVSTTRNQPLVSVFAKVRTVPTVASVSLSSVRNGGEGRGEEALGNGDTVRMGGAPLSPTLSPFVPHGARETDAPLVRAAPTLTFATTDSGRGDEAEGGSCVCGAVRLLTSAATGRLLK